ncbi:MAG TPA: hypothetical protein PLV19_07665 [Nitrosomonas sp.]|nr:hypothetical protein [Nitrosomonas sp.]HQU98454.1 hypothetical protein [Nitrosomonas sp.]HQX14034.1 hypothetical protein [Nitrosomonas sp.]HRB20181.1 hypothetical protein [Nitrosomonas sp.]HRB33174.1 hypothetical protein [Nitrosomonas sp.]
MSDRDEYIKKIQSKLDEWDSDIDELKDKLAAASADAKIAIDDKLKQLSKQRDEISDKLEELEDAGEDVWEDIRDNIESGWKRVTAEFEDLVKRFKS